MHILVTGGAGFVGSNFVRMTLGDRLPGLEGAAVTVLDALTYAGNPANLAPVAEHPHYAFVQGDIRDTALLDRRLPGVDAIVHCAAEHDATGSARDASVFVETNVVGTQRLLDAALRHGVRRVVHVSTDDVYGPIEAGAWSEEHPLEPGTPCAASQAASDLLARSYHRAHGLDVRVARGSSAYGPFHSPEHSLPGTLTSLIDGLPAPASARPDQVRGWLHVDDLCRGIALVLTGGRPGEAYNIGGAELSALRLAELLHAAAGHDAPAAPTTAGDAQPAARRSVDTAKIAGELGFAPEVALEPGLADLVQWYRDHRSWWEPLKERAAL